MRFVRPALLGILVLLLLSAGWLWLKLIRPPALALVPLAADAVALDSPEGQVLLAGALRADHEALVRSYVPQQTPSFCGVASSVIVLGAAGVDVDQDRFFTEPVLAERSWWRTTFMGMPLEAFGAQLEAHGRTVQVHHADVGLQAFRNELQRNLASPGDWLVVNYDRSTLGEQGGGHFSPVSAWNPEQDKVLILDTASYKYPAHWVPVDALYRAMDTVDSETGARRGWAHIE